MLSKEDNDLITQTGPGTPCGELMRRYWHPVALAREIPLGGAPKPVRLLGEDLVLFRTKQGEPGLMDLHCPHRGTDLSYGRVEDDGLRCLYHGWKMGLDGRCLDQPGEPKGSNFKNKVRHVAYPCREAGGLIMTYMGPGEAPPLPKLPIFEAPASHVWSSKLFHECNYLQGTEGEVDSQHLSYLHRMASPDKAPDQVQQETDFLLAVDESPDIDFEQTQYGLRLFATAAARRRAQIRAHHQLHHALYRRVRRRASVRSAPCGEEGQSRLLDALARADRRHASLEIHRRPLPRHAAGAGVPAPDHRNRRDAGVRPRSQQVEPLSAEPRGDGPAHLPRHGLQLRGPRPLRDRIASARSPTARASISAPPTAA